MGLSEVIMKKNIIKRIICILMLGALIAFIPAR